MILGIVFSILNAHAGERGFLCHARVFTDERVVLLDCPRALMPGDGTLLKGWMVIDGRPQRSAT